MPTSHRHPYKGISFLEKNAFCNADKSHIYQQLESIYDACPQLFSAEQLDAIARKHGFIKRGRKLPASSFVKSLIFSNEDCGQLSLLDLKGDLLRHSAVSLSKTALHKRFTPEAVSFLQEVFATLLAAHTGAQGMSSYSNPCFTGIYIKDSTKFKLPNVFAKEYPSYGSFGKDSSLMNIQYEFELTSGSWQHLELTKATRNDQEDSRQTAGSIVKGGLYLRDLGYVTSPYLRAVERHEAYYLNRLPQAGAYQKVDGQLKELDWKRIDKLFSTTTLKHLELEVYIGKEAPIKTRLIITPVPEGVAGERIRKAAQGGKRKNGYTLSQTYRIKARYNIYITNVPLHVMPAMQVVETYRLRWQVELVFKTWKSTLSIHKHKAMNINRFKCQLVAKLIWVLLNSKMLQVASQMIRDKDQRNGCSPVKFYKWAKTASQELRQVMGCGKLLPQWFYASITPILDDLVIEKKGKKNTHCEILANFVAC